MVGYGLHRHLVVQQMPSAVSLGGIQTCPGSGAIHVGQGHGRPQAAAKVQAAACSSSVGLWAMWQPVGQAQQAQLQAEQFWECSDAGHCPKVGMAPPAAAQH